jgi:hypothetical protein
MLSKTKHVYYEENKSSEVNSNKTNAEDNPQNKKRKIVS